MLAAALPLTHSRGAALAAMGPKIAGKTTGPADVVAQTSLLKIGKRLAVGDVLMYSAGESVPCARASVTYAIPSVRLDPPVE